jgi:hypothetical protein
MARSAKPQAVVTQVLNASQTILRRLMMSVE